MKVKEIRQRFLTALYRIHQREGFQSQHEYRDVVSESEIDPNDTRVATVVQELRDEGVVRGPFMKTYDGIISHVTLTNRGIEEVEEQLEDDEPASPTSAIPAADRYVLVTHNSARPEEVRSEFEKALGALHGINDPELLDDRTLAAIAEFESAKLLISQPQVNVDLVDRCIKSAGAWLTLKFASHAIGGVIGAALAKFAEWWMIISALPH